MSQELMLHFDAVLDADERESLSSRLHAEFGAQAEMRDSSKPHLLFVSVDLQKASPHQVLEAVRRWGHQAQLVDL